VRSDLNEDTKSTTVEPGRVSGRFLSDLFGSLERHQIPATQLLGDLPIPIDENGRVARSIDWADFAAFMKRLEHHLGGPDGLELCGERIGELKPAPVLAILAGFSASPYALYRAASLWALRRALPGVDAQIEETSPNQIEIHVELKDGLRPCPQLFHLGVGGARALPRVLGLRDAVVSAKIEEREAHFQIIVPPSQTLWARVRRVFRTVFSASSVLQFLEAQQLELHEKHEALQRTHAALAESERRYRAITDTAVDVLCELNENGQIEYVSASIEDLLGYRPEQVTGSHFSLWVPAPYREIAKQRLAAFASQPIEQAINRQRIALHTESGDQIVAELSLRSYRTPEGELRMVGILRDQSEKTSRPVNARPEVESNEDELLAATARMSQIVENAMVQAPDDAASFRWLETEKLVDMLEFEFHTHCAIAGAELEIDISGAPSLIWGDETMLVSCLAKLLEWTAGMSQTPPIVALRAERAGTRALVFSVSTTSELAREPRDGNGIAPQLAAVEDAANALGGALILPETDSDECLSRIQLPQPGHPD
jgi:PAS domain S-box-containing protein